MTDADLHEGRRGEHRRHQPLSELFFEKPPAILSMDRLCGD